MVHYNENLWLCSSRHQRCLEGRPLVWTGGYINYKWLLTCTANATIVMCGIVSSREIDLPQQALYNQTTPHLPSRFGYCLELQEAVCKIHVHTHSDSMSSSPQGKHWMELYAIILCTHLLSQHSKVTFTYIIK